MKAYQIIDRPEKWTKGALWIYEHSGELTQKVLSAGVLNKSARRRMSKNKKHVIVRTYSAGVFAGYLQSRNGQEVVLTKARRLWYWSGAASLSQLAVSGTSKPQECKFPVAVPRVELLQAVEILDTTKEAQKSIEGVPVWQS